MPRLQLLLERELDELPSVVDVAGVDIGMQDELDDEVDILDTDEDELDIAVNDEPERTR